MQCTFQLIKLDQCGKVLLPTSLPLLSTDTHTSHVAHNDKWYKRLLTST